MIRTKDTLIAGLLACALTALACAQLFAGRPGPSAGSTRSLPWLHSPLSPQAGPAATEGKQVFESRCAECHGLDGHGGERAPDIATSAKTQARSDEQLNRIISRGIPGTGMPPFASLSEENRKSIISYLRLLQGKIVEEAKLAGDPQKGRALFFGKARCAECHALAGSGGFIGQDLSTYGAVRAVAKIRDAIVNPENGGSRVTVVTKQSQTYSGIVRNEDNFSVQIQALDGSFHFFAKSELSRFTRGPGSFMPSDYGSILSAREIDDLVNFLVTAGREAKALIPTDTKVHDEGADDDE
jgi:cytochrome c oxidase cbb3-type subunit 3